jgi:hypothetical protein
VKPAKPSAASEVLPALVRRRTLGGFGFATGARAVLLVELAVLAERAGVAAFGAPSPLWALGAETALSAARSVRRASKRLSAPSARMAR